MERYRKLIGLEHQPRTLLITGATSGIGRAAALLFAALGDNVGAVGRSTERLQAVCEQAEHDDLKGQILPLEADVTDAEAMQRAAALTVAEFNRLDVVVACAGVGHRGPLADADWADIETTLRTNIDGVLHTVRAAIPALRASGGGHIVLISSIVGPVPAPYAAAYSASKAAVDAFGRSLRAELRADHIHVSVLWVGQVHTEFAKNRLGQPGKVASRWPTMTPEYVAGGIVRALERKPRAKTLRLLDSALVWLGRTLPWVTDRLFARIYG